MDGETKEYDLSASPIVEGKAKVFVYAFSVFLVIGFSGLVLLYNYKTVADASQEITENGERLLVDRIQLRNNADFAAVMSDVLYLSNEGLMKALLDDDTAANRQALAGNYLAFSRQKENYEQIRFIDERGVEIVRVESDIFGQRIAPDTRLQDKSDRYYVTETLSLHRDQVYVSPFDLNVEQGIVEQPVRPTTRIATPVFDDDGRKRGMVVVNYNGRRLLDRLRTLASQSAGDLWLLNAQGYWLLGPSRADEWAFMYPDRQERSFAHAYPHAWQAISRTFDASQFDADGDLVTVAATAVPGTPGFWGHTGTRTLDVVSVDSTRVVSFVPAAVIASANNPLRRNFAIIFAALVLIESGAAYAIFVHWTARQQAQQAAQRSDANFRGLFEAAPDGILITDDAGAIVLANAELGHMFGLDRNGLIGRPAEMLLPEFHAELEQLLGFGRDAPFAGPGLRMSAETGTAADAPPAGAGEEERWAVRPDGTRFPVEIRLNPVVPGSANLTFTSVRDVTERHQRDRTISEMSERLAHDNAELKAAVEDLNLFSYSVAHDLRAPLRAVHGFSDIFLNDYGDRLDDIGREYATRLSQASIRMGAIIDDILHLSRVSRAEYVPTDVDLSAIAQSIVGEMRQREPDRAVQIDIAPDLRAEGDLSLIHVIVLNLLENAWKYSSKTAAARIEFGCQRSNGVPCFFVRDNGCGFDMAYAHKLFRPFERLHSEDEFEGTGIGLATVQRAVRRHGGAVWAAGEPGKGATFHFTLQEGHAEGHTESEVHHGT